MKRARNAGAVAIEFAIVGVVFVTMLLLAMDISWQMVIEAALGAGGRAASRFGTTGAVAPIAMTPAPASRDASILQLVIQNSGGLLQNDPTLLTITEASYANFAAVANGVSTVGPGTSSQVVQYTFTYRQAYLTPIAIAIAGPDLLHTLTVTVVNEPFPTP
jgi:hypothetical protein